MPNSWLLQTCDEIPHFENTESTEEKKINKRLTDTSRNIQLNSLGLSEVNISSKGKGADKGAHTRSSSLTESLWKSGTEEINPLRFFLLQNQGITRNSRDHQHRQEDSDTSRTVIRGQINVPCSVRKKIFMIYICGGYQGTVKRL